MSHLQNVYAILLHSEIADCVTFQIDCDDWENIFYKGVLISWSSTAEFPRQINHIDEHDED
jgi:hypothetical protein